MVDDDGLCKEIFLLLNLSLFPQNVFVVLCTEKLQKLIHMHHLCFSSPSLVPLCFRAECVEMFSVLFFNAFLAVSNIRLAFLTAAVQ